MIEIQDMNSQAVDGLLERIGYGHLGCSLGDQPYVVPIHYSFRKPNIYIYTMAGMKSEIISVNPSVCLQVEEVFDDGGWQSVMVTGIAEELKGADRERAMEVILADNPGLTPALSLRWRDNWITENVEVIYRITPAVVAGRYATRVETSAAVSNGVRQRPEIY